MLSSEVLKLENFSDLNRSGIESSRNNLFTQKPTNSSASIFIFSLFKNQIASQFIENYCAKFKHSWMYTL